MYQTDIKGIYLNINGAIISLVDNMTIKYPFARTYQRYQPSIHQCFSLITDQHQSK